MSHQEKYHHVQSGKSCAQKVISSEVLKVMQGTALKDMQCEESMTKSALIYSFVCIYFLLNKIQLTAINESIKRSQVTLAVH